MEGEAPLPPVLFAVDDEPSHLDLLTKVLRQAYKVFPFSDPREAQKAAASLRPAIVVTDYRMPFMTGVDLLRALRRDFDFAALLVTGNGDLEEVAQAQRENLVTRVVLKPWRPNELKTQVDLSHGLFLLQTRKKK